MYILASTACCCKHHHSRQLIGKGHCQLPPSTAFLWEGNSFLHFVHLIQDPLCLCTYTCPVVVQRMRSKKVLKLTPFTLAGPKDGYLPLLYDASNILSFCFAIRPSTGVLVWTDFQGDRTEGLERLHCF